MAYTRSNQNTNNIIQWAVVTTDFLLMNLLLLAFLFLPEPFVAHHIKISAKLFFLLANFAMIIGEYFYHTIIHLRKVKTTDVMRRVAKLVIVQAIILFILMKLMTSNGQLIQFFILYTISLYIILMLSRIIERNALEKYRLHGRNTRQVLFIGNDPANLNMYRELVGDPTMGYVVLGYYSNGIIEDAPKDFKKLGDIDHDLKKILNDKEFNHRICDDIFCSLSHDEYEKIVKVMRFCDRNVIHFFYVPRQFGNYRLQLKTERFGDMNVLTNYVEPLLNPTNKFIKRSFDIVFSSIVCLCMLPFIPIIALIIKIQSPGPIFFKQERTGLNGETFECIKFRSMHVNKDADTEQATKEDPRKFKFGNFMRKANIDELPQFFNVLKGDMSIVGPRPHMLYHTDVYSKLISKYMVRHFSKPGITGWAQVTGYRGETKELWQMEERVRRDIWYIEHWSFWLDIKIILMTVKSVFKHDENAY